MANIFFQSFSYNTLQYRKKKRNCIPG